MAISRTWIAHIETFVDTFRPSAQQDASLEAIAKLLKNDELTIEELVKEMEMYLTTSDHVLRARGILLLAEVLTRLATKPVDSVTMHSLISFFTSRLADWQALRGALVGCLALLRRRSNVGMVVTTDARMLMESYLQNLQVQSLALHDRKLCFEILECLLDRYADAVVALGDDLVYGICAAIDEEKDPQCLLLVFHIVEVLVQIFGDPLSPMSSFAGDLFDILGRYYPIYFTHPKTDELDIKRDDLSRALMHAFASTPLFEPFVIPLLLEKLSSSLLSAKLDSLKYLSHCTLHYGADRMAKHSKVIWSSLKQIIFSSSPKDPSLSLGFLPLNGMGSQDDEVTKEAEICLERIVALLSHESGSSDHSFINLIIVDEDLDMIFRSVTGVSHNKVLTLESRQKLHALGRILFIAAKVSSASCNRVFQSFFTRLMGVLGIPLRRSPEYCILNGSSYPQMLNFGALHLCTEVLAACRDLTVNCKEFSVFTPVVEDSWYAMLQNFSGPLADILASALLTSRNCDTEEAYICSGVKSLQTLAMFPGSLMLTSRATYEKILSTLMSIITKRCEDKLLWEQALKALIQVGTYGDSSHDSEKQISYMNIVVEEAVSLLSLHNSKVPLPLKLEAIYGIGAIGLNYMKRFLQGTEEAISANFVKAIVDGNLMSADVIIHLLRCYSNQVLPWLNKTEGCEDIVMNIAVKIWEQLENSMTLNVRLQVQEGLLDVTMTAMRLAVGGCATENQALIVQKAYSILSSETISQLKKLVPIATIKLENIKHTLDFVSLSCRDEWLISLFSSVLIALRPQTCIPEIREILHFLTIFLLKGYIPAAQAMGSIVNKWPSNIKMEEASRECALEEVLDIVLENGLQNILLKDPLGHETDESSESSSILCHIDGDSLLRNQAIIGLAWIGKGLVMRGHERVRETAMLFLKCLLSVSNEDIISQQQNMLANRGGGSVDLSVVRSAADAFHILLSDCDVCLNKNFHATIKPLYKQHFFSRMVPILQSSIENCHLSIVRGFLYRAFGHLISDTPLLVVVTEAKKLLPSLLNALFMLSKDVVNKDLTYSLLLVLSGILMDEIGKESVLENAPAIIACLVNLTSYPHMMCIRETAIQCLIAMTELPHARIYPLRTQVLQTMNKALDDPKRAVRQEAVRCRQAWASIASRSLHF